MNVTLWLATFAAATGAMSMEDQAAELMLSAEAAQVISSADTCGFKIESQALSEFMSGTIASLHDAARFNYYAVTTTFPSELEAMSPTAKAASCALQESLGRKHGLVNSPN